VLRFCVTRGLWADDEASKDADGRVPSLVAEERIDYPSDVSRGPRPGHGSCWAGRLRLSALSIRHFCSVSPTSLLASSSSIFLFFWSGQFFFTECVADASLHLSSLEAFSTLSHPAGGASPGTPIQTREHVALAENGRGMACRHF